MDQSESPINRQPSLSAQVYAALTKRIASGAVEPGERIVVERIAEQLGVSPTPVREALARLIQEGLIEEEANKRLRLVPLTQGYVFDTFFVRGALEGLAAELAAQRITKAQLSTLEEAVGKSAQALPNGEFDVYVQSDLLLHTTILQVADNLVLARELHALRSHVDYIRGYSQRKADDRHQHSQEEHERVLAALVLRDAGAARQEMEQHIRNIGQRVVQLTNFGTIQPQLSGALPRG
jgi:DNA-binding GntR family transcriptional regulator